MSSVSNLGFRFARWSGLLFAKTVPEAQSFLPLERPTVNSRIPTLPMPSALRSSPFSLPCRSPLPIMPPIASAATKSKRASVTGSSNGGSSRERKRKASPVESSTTASSKSADESSPMSTDTSSSSSGKKSSSSKASKIRNGGASAESPAKLKAPPPPLADITVNNKDDDQQQRQNVRVVARLRLLSTKEVGENNKETITGTMNKANKLGIIRVDKTRKFEYDAVFGPSTTQSQVYELTAGDTVQRNIFRGFNVTILAYGQTGSGKTFTMGTSGSDDDASENADQTNINSSTLTAPTESDGIIPRAVYDLFKTRASLPNGTDRVKVELSYLEIYNEEARDLMYNGDKAAPDLHIRDSKAEGVVVQNLSRHVVKSPTDVANLMKGGSERRVTASTNMNAVSSRSHAVCTLYVTIAPSQDDDGIAEEIRAKLTLVDLAGSERIKRTGAEGARMREGININKGLFVLGQVVSALSDLGQQQSSSSSSSSSSNNAHIPYRDSKLTRLLQDSLGGNSKTVMVACVSPAESNVEESINTLRYAERARNIKNSAVRNVVATSMSPAEAAALRRENQMLKLQLLQAQMATASAGPAAVMSITSAAAAAARGASASMMSSMQDESTLLQGINVERLEIVTRLRANITSMKAKVSQLEQRNIQCAEDALIASFKADKWRQKYECLIAAMAAKAIDVPEEVKDDATEGETLAVQLRRELSELREELRESQTDAEVARATAAAVVAGEGDLSTVEQLALAGEEKTTSAMGEDGDGTNDGGSDDDNDSSKLSAELMAVDGEIDRKEAMADQMNKERVAMDALKSHFEEAMQRLQEEVGVLSSERESLLKKVGSSGGPVAGKKRSASSKSTSDPAEESVEKKRMRQRIADLEDRIKGLKKKAAEHAKSLRMREMAEKKCSQLAAEIAEDKKRRGALQRQLKEAAVQRRSDKKAAQQQAARMLRDSQKMKSELQKVKDKASRQAAVLRRKAAEALSKQKMLEEQQRKRNNAAAMRSSRATTNSVGLQRKEELNNWLEKELNCATTLKDIRDQIEEQTMMIQETTSKKNEILSKGKKHESAAALQSLELEIGTRKSVIDQLEKNCEEVYKSVLGSARKASGSSCFVDVSTWQGLSRQEIRVVETITFERLVEVSKEVSELRSQKEESQKAVVQKAVSEERRKAEDAVMKLKMEHSEAMMTLLESTKESVQHRLRQDLTAVGIGEDGLDDSTKAAIDDMLASYLSGCEWVGQTVKDRLDDVREKHDSMKNFVDSVAKGIIAQNEASALLKSTKKKKKPNKKTSPLEEDDFDLFDDDDAFEDSSSDDSDWAPTPAPQKKRRTNRGGGGGSKATKSVAERDSMSELAGEKISQPDAENDKDNESEAAAAAAPKSSNLESMTVAELKEALKKEGKAVSGRKHELIKRLRAANNNAATSSSSASNDDAISPSITSQAVTASKENKTPPFASSAASPSRSPSSSRKAAGKRRAPRRAPLSSDSGSSKASSNQSVTSSQRAASAATPKRPELPRPRNPTSRLKRQKSAPSVMTDSARKRRRKSMAAAVEEMEKAANNALKK